MTRLGEFSPIGRLFTLGRSTIVGLDPGAHLTTSKFTPTAPALYWARAFFKSRIKYFCFQRSQQFWDTSFHVTIDFDKKWATFWAIFSQTHLVNLVRTTHSPTKVPKLHCYQLSCKMSYVFKHYQSFLSS
jgi:hypothetical protein